MTLKRSAAITGIAELRPSRSAEGKSILGIWTEVSRQAILDAGLGTGDIDGLLIGPPITEQAPMWPSVLGEYLNIHPRYANVVDLGGASPCGMVWRAAAAIQSGLCRAVLCVTGEASDVETFYAQRPHRPAQQLPYREFEVPYGPMGVNSGYALIARRHMHEYGTTSRQLAKIAADQRTNACANPEALFYGQPLTVDDVLASPLVVDPLHLLEIVRPCTGGAAVVVVSPDLAKESPSASGGPVWLLGAGEASRGIMLSQFETLTTSPIASAAPVAFAMAGVSHKDIDLVSVYDCYTITVLITLEDAGFCPKGRGGGFVEEHDLTYGGDLPLNTHGGQLSFGQPGLAGGMSHVTEAVRQLRGRAGERQVRDCQLAFVNGNGGIMSEQVSLILGVE